MTFEMIALKAIFLLLTITILTAAHPQPDENESCSYWAEIGECEKNPNFMLQSCQQSCAQLGGETAPSTKYNSFYDIVEKDIDGGTLHFSDFRGKVVYLVNVASQCGYTESNYALFRQLAEYKDKGLEIVLAPCNAFGAQEPGDGGSIVSFAKSKGFVGTILSKAEVNGADTRASFEYLKLQTGKSYIKWNFDGKFLVDRIGKVYTPSDDVEADIITLLNLSEEDL
jgi:glutathione peroxidase